MATRIEFPKLYQRVYQRAQALHGHIIYEAMDRLRAMPVPDDLRPFFAYQTWENPQPSFILFPFMFLLTAEASGGITDRHRQYLPTIMLAAELCAVADDTIDRAPARSGRETFAARFGDPSALPLASALSSMVLAESRRDDRLFDAAQGFLVPFFGLELWERANTYPPPSVFSSWLEHRYAQAIVATEYVLNSALILNGEPLWPRAAVAAFSQIGQDVDDIVNVVEYRERDGENDDLQSGVVTRPLIFAIEEVPELGDEVAALWAKYRPLADMQLSIAELSRRRARLNRTTRPLYARIRREIVDRGVPRAVKQCLTEFHAAVRATPQRLRPLMRELASAFLDRLRRCEYVELAAYEEAEPSRRAG
jgi:hypothetical protein